MIQITDYYGMIAAVFVIVLGIVMLLLSIALLAYAIKSRDSITVVVTILSILAILSVAVFKLHFGGIL